MGLRHLRHEVGRGGPAAHRGHRPRPQPGPDLRLLRQRGGRRPSQRPPARRRGPPGVAGGRLRGAARTLRRRGRGRLPGHAADAAADQGRAGALGALLDGRQRHPRGRADPGAPRGLRAPLPGDRRPGVPRGPERRGHQWRGRGQRHPRRVRGHRQLPLRPGPHRGGGDRARPRGVRGLRRRGVRGRRPQRRRAARPLPPGRRGLHRGGGRRPAAQVRLDGRLPLRRARHPRGQLRPRQPAPGAQAGRAGGDRQDPRGRGATARLAHGLTGARPGGRTAWQGPRAARAGRTRGRPPRVTRVDLRWDGTTGKRRERTCLPGTPRGRSSHRTSSGSGRSSGGGTR
ncbi:hypothetical protein SGPA1_12010 [Streptomyces misionensis JCM 4497]